MVKLSDNAIAIAEKRYFAKGENWEALCRRVGKSISFNETDKKWEEKFSSELFDMNFIPGGRILRNSGKIKQSMLNCACLPISDSIESIGETIKSALILWSYGAGIGIDFSPLREKGRPLVSKGGESSGMISFLRAINVVASTIETGGQRRSGALAMLKVTHPEIMEFIDLKTKDKELPYFNLSVAVDKQFLDAVENGDDWDLVFSGQKVKTVKAQDIWDKIVDSMIKSGEPGLINYDNLIKNNSFYFQNIECTNLCGELPLPGWGTCCLGSLVLPSFIVNKNTNWKKLSNSIETAVRFLDNVLDVNFYPIKQSEQVTKDARRIGLGVMGLHDFLITKSLRYGSEEALVETERLFKFIRDTAYTASIKLATEKGTFPKYNKNEYSNASFVRKLPPQIRIEIKEKGIRNVCCISAPPTGTSSLLADVSSGIEPHFALAYQRKDRVSDRYYIHPKLIEYIKSGEKERPSWLIDSSDLTPENHLDMQVVIAKYVDNAVSKTINCPSTITSDQLSKLLREYIRDTKGMTVYVDQSKSGQVLNKIPFRDIKKIIDNEFSISSEIDESLVDCVRGSCGI